jgi:hypothetical protein
LPSLAGRAMLSGNDYARHFVMASGSAGSPAYSSVAA